MEDSYQLCPRYMKLGWCSRRGIDCDYAHFPEFQKSNNLGDCWSWTKQGVCKFGANCKYLHDPKKRAKVEDCIFWKTGEGYCQLGESCPKKHHPQKRSPSVTKLCTYYPYCRLGERCRYDHSDIHNELVQNFEVSEESGNFFLKKKK